MTKERFKLGVTGGIGSGKTSVCRVFQILHVPVFSADNAAQEIMDSDTRIKEGINTIAGKDLYKEGSLDRLSLAGIIFKDNSLLYKVNTLVHPVVFEHFGKWVMEQTSPYVIMEAAILFESGASEIVDRIATIIAPEEERIQRVILRNRLTREQIIDRMRNQMDDETRMKKSDYIINNSENEMIIPAILNIHSDILNFINN
jgi:dephospho-CoA kinase